MAERPTDEFTDPNGGDGAWDGGLEDAVAPPSPRRRRRTVLVTAAVLAALAVGTGVLLQAQERDRRTPEAAVLEYVTLIEDGDVEAATALVPVPGEPAADVAPPVHLPPVDGLVPETSDLPPGAQVTRLVEPALLENAAYGTNPGITDITVEEIDPGRGTAVGETVDVVVTYSVRDFPASTVLRVERLPDAFPALPSWRVVDSLTVPVLVRLDDPGVGTPDIDGVAAVASGEPSAGHEQLATMLYPGVYDVGLEEQTYLSVRDVELRVAGAREATAATEVAPTTAFLNVTPSSAAYELALAEANAFLDDCATRPPAVDIATCPDAYRRSAAAGEEATFTTGFTRTSMAAASEPTGDGGVRPVVLGFIEGTVVVSTAEDARNLAFNLEVTLRIAGDDVEVDVRAGENG